MTEYYYGAATGRFMGDLSWGRMGRARLLAGQSQRFRRQVMPQQRRIQPGRSTVDRRGVFEKQNKRQYAGYRQTHLS